MMSVKKRSAALVLVLALVLSLVFGTASEAFALSGGLKIDGSTTVQPLAQLLANSFHTANPAVTISVAGGGSGVGVTDALSGAVNIGMSSSVVKPELQAAGAYPTAMAKDAVCVIVNPANPIRALTKQQIKDIYTGRITNWRQISASAPNKSIIVCGRAAGSGTADYMASAVFGTSTRLVTTLKTYSSNGLLRNAVKANAYAVGYVGMAYADTTVRACKINGYLPTRLNARSSAYPLVRNLFWVTKGAPKTGTLAKAFIDYSLGTAGQAQCNKLYMSLK
jgi:phosphate transport system substrate-binding protein